MWKGQNVVSREIALHLELDSEYWLLSLEWMARSTLFFTVGTLILCQSIDMACSSMLRLTQKASLSCGESPKYVRRSTPPSHLGGLELDPETWDADPGEQGPCTIDFWPSRGGRSQQWKERGLSVGGWGRRRQLQKKVPSQRSLLS